MAEHGPNDPNGVTRGHADERYQGLWIGPYHLLRIIGEGGFGIVWLAERHAPLMLVALKMIKPGMGSDEVLERFEAERQAVALMDHPNIAHILDAGTAGPEFGSRPYFVMEYVPGKPITEYADDQQLNIRQRLQLFIEVCEAMQHAHIKRVIHRDLTPRNILVYKNHDDNRIVLKVIDFGIAKALDHPLTGKHIFTEQGRMLGVLEYMSPEQAAGGRDIDSQADVYSLGVVLYELLTGTTPFKRSDFLNQGWEAMLRFIREAQAPPPSTRLSGMGESAAEVARLRQSNPGRLTRQLRQDLQYIPLKAIESDRRRRYQTCNDLAAAIRAYLNGEPILPPGGRAWYRLRKFARRNRALVTTASLVGAALLVGLIASLVLLDEANRNAYNANVAAAGALVLANNAQSASARLDACVPALRSWEWRRLRHVCDRSTAWFDANDILLSVSFDSAGSTVNVLGPETVYRLSPPALDSRGIFEFTSQASPVLHPCMSRDGSAVLFRSRDAAGPPSLTLCRSDFSRQQIDPGAAAEAWLPDLRPAISADGSVVVAPVRAGDRSLLVVQWPRDGSRREIEPAWPFRHFALSPDGASIVTASLSSDGVPRLDLWSCRDGARTSLRCDRAIGDALNGLVVGSNGGCIAVTGPIGTHVLRRQTRGSAPVLSLEPGDRLAITPDGRRLAIAAGSLIRVHDLDTGGSSTLRGHNTRVHSIALSDDGRQLASISPYGVVGLWTIAPDEFASGSAHITAATASADGRCIVVLCGTTEADGAGRPAEERGLVRLFDTESSTFRSLPDPPSGQVFLATIASDGKCLALATDRDIQIRDLPSGRPRHSAPLSRFGISTDDVRHAARQNGPHLSIPFESSSQLVAMIPHANSDGEVLLLDFSDLSVRVLASAKHREAAVLAAGDASPTAYGFGSRIFVWKAGLGSAPSAYAGAIPPGFLCFEPAGSRIAIAGLGGKVAVVSTDTGRSTMSAASHADRVNAVVWLNGHGRLASGGKDGNVIVWDAATLEQRLVEPMGASVAGLAYQPATGTLWAVLANGRIRQLAAGAQGR